VWEVFDAVLSGKISELDIKKIKNESSVFRVRCGQIRVIYKKEKEKVFIVSVGRRSEKTYKI
jgi:mRNA-degrading endonuclease RelE of RelBE toxin-antitoxin system